MHPLQQLRHACGPSSLCCASNTHMYRLQQTNGPMRRFKLTRQATADLTFDMCATDAFTVNISSVAPLPVNLTLDGAPVQLAGAGVPLLRPLIKVWGGKTAALDGTPTGEAYDAAEERDLHAWVSKFIPLAASYAGEEVAVPLSSELQVRACLGAWGPRRARPRACSLAGIFVCNCDRPPQHKTKTCTQTHTPLPPTRRRATTT